MMCTPLVNVMVLNLHISICYVGVMLYPMYDHVSSNLNSVTNSLVERTVFKVRELSVCGIITAGAAESGGEWVSCTYR